MTKGRKSFMLVVAHLWIYGICFVMTRGFLSIFGVAEPDWAWLIALFACVTVCYASGSLYTRLVYYFLWPLMALKVAEEEQRNESDAWY